MNNKIVQHSLTMAGSGLEQAAQSGEQTAKSGEETAWLKQVEDARLALIKGDEYYHFLKN